MRCAPAPPGPAPRAAFAPRGTCRARPASPPHLSRSSPHAGPGRRGEVRGAAPSGEQRGRGSASAAAFGFMATPGRGEPEAAGVAGRPWAG